MSHQKTKKTIKNSIVASPKMDVEKRYTKEQLKEAFGYYAFASVSSNPYNLKEFEDEFENFVSAIN